MKFRIHSKLIYKSSKVSFIIISYYSYHIIIKYTNKYHIIYMI